MDLAIGVVGEPCYLLSHDGCTSDGWRRPWVNSGVVDGVCGGALAISGCASDGAMEGNWGRERVPARKSEWVDEQEREREKKKIIKKSV